MVNECYQTLAAISGQKFGAKQSMTDYWTRVYSLKQRPHHAGNKRATNREPINNIGRFLAWFVHCIVSRPIFMPNSKLSSHAKTEWL